ncbi:MAG: hypothetical protein Q8L60_13340 [Gammaproteobacteria bacterium]|nr:hypothetical protein [Gammaproteobacteria bacterium]MDP2346262.1 hypothetical protein [Gammaproteobacteria bacterium]
MVRLLVFLIPLISFLQEVTAQEAIARGRWFEVDTGNFRVFSQLSRGQSERRAAELEQWRDAAISILGSAVVPSRDPIQTYFYIFEEENVLRLFAEGGEPSYLYASPRAAFIITTDSNASLDLAQHHYSHFLINNRPIGVPRWYEEGMANYLSRLSINSGDVELRAFRDQEYEFALTLNEVLSLNALLYDDSALASPRLIQIANLKAAMFVHFLLHGHEREGFTDRRTQLQNYLGFLQQGRTERFAYDQAFNVPVSALERDFDRFLETSLTSTDSNRSLMRAAERRNVEAVQPTPDEVMLALAELSLHSGKFNAAEVLFGDLVNRQSTVGRAYSGFADAQRLRLREPEEMEPDVVPFYMQAVAMDDSDPQLFLDYGQYLDTELGDCERGYSVQERLRMQEDMREYFGRALALDPESPEVNLSYAQIFLMEGQDWQQGLNYQHKAFAVMPADSFIMEQAIKYEIAAARYDDARTLIARLARPMHFWGTPPWIAELNNRLQAAERGQAFDSCAASTP